jgi:nicotinamidase-related amidase
MKALLVMDMIRLYIYGEKPLIPVANRKNLITKIRTAIDWAHDSHVPVIYVNTAFHEDDPILKIIGHRAQAILGHKDTQVIQELTPVSDDKMLEKRGYDGFWKSGLEALLKKMKVSEVYLCGQQTDCCIRETGVTAAHLGYKVTILEDCCDTSRELGQASALRFMKTCVGQVINSDSL